MDELDKLLSELQDGVSGFAPPGKAGGNDGSNGAPKGFGLNKDIPAFGTPMSQFSNTNQDSFPSHGDEVDRNLVPSATPCFSCNRPIMGVSVVALGERPFHQDCFRCCVQTCRRRLTGMQYFEVFPDVYCEGCYHDKFSQKCAYCEQAIKDRCISALGKCFHPEHFFCAQCGRTFGPNESFMESDGMAYCEEDFSALFAYECTRCKHPLAGDYIVQSDKKYHRECFACTQCKRALAADNAFEHEGYPYCERDYHVLTAPKCATCENPLIGRAVRACGKRYHVECFQCYFCKNQLDLPTQDPGWGGAARGNAGFRQHDENPYCHRCFVKLYA
ncbi:uncharacterized protein EV422DRAFT_366267 [Fimicolochytrium jonesii]|uniref:uncharacterized protein n=1 Tax=Fimicolochytrium jonesii TaxID=1396493 RepID=UPI0022FDECB8|nr:uncharacterized protein EV422DRAFT_366267 [Fimicolochytrium jonesii]KAI8823687.1 hypothetical protein EV422DRAFT_366267 [Fimicolochytrium jonesii]